MINKPPLYFACLRGVLSNAPRGTRSERNNVAGEFIECIALPEQRNIAD
jgi:hypothetical protein